MTTEQTHQHAKRGRISIDGFDAESIEKREPLSDWQPSLESEEGKGRLYYAWKRFKSNRLALFGAAVIVIMTLMTIFSRPITVAGVPVQPISLAPYDPAAQDVLTGYSSPSAEHLFGTDWAGRDILSRIMYGARWSLSIGFIAVGVAMLIGVPLGAIAGYFGGWVDELIMRVVDLLYAFPFIVLAIAIIAVLGRGYWEMVMALVLTGWLAYARIIRGEILSVKENEYVTAAKALGATDRKIISRHILPNAMAPVIVQATLSVGTVVLAAAALGFIGLGLSPASAEWGVMLNVANANGAIRLGYWWAAIFPGLAIFMFVLSINLLGDGVRDAFDPQGSTSQNREGGGL
ncbi:ABC transporter permease subunit [Halovenus sp. WSH3]|uniref:ABC transporter permease subunit n=1 Tax=Halovenus carboxidivorans TaxID=2692199 RepID=A0A6B0TBC4_9EURY|nr:ABC transporter permease [Halovenus carboxidivorans]MXR52200.1 ABC transporter permease subunit [Halovenus carboxidivorans]